MRPRHARKGGASSTVPVHDERSLCVYPDDRTVLHRPSSPGRSRPLGPRRWVLVTARNWLQSGRVQRHPLTRPNPQWCAGPTSQMRGGGLDLRHLGLGDDVSQLAGKLLIVDDS
jgi:hypothetical protein